MEDDQQPGSSKLNDNIRVLQESGFFAITRARRVSRSYMRPIDHIVILAQRAFRNNVLSCIKLHGINVTLQIKVEP